MAESMGVDTARYRVKVFVLAALLAALSGWLYAHMQRFVNPTPFNLNIGIEYLFMAVVGGCGPPVGRGARRHARSRWSRSSCRTSCRGCWARAATSR